MALKYSQILYGFFVIAGVNDKLDFKEAGNIKAATLNPGTYSAQAYAAEVQRAMRAAVGGASTTNICTWSQATLKFTLSGTAVFQLLFSSDTAANYLTSCGNLLGFHVGAGAGADDKTGAATYDSTSAAGSVNSTATLWTCVEPNDYTSPVSANAVGVAASLTQRKVFGSQAITDGSTVETIYFSSLRLITVSFRALLLAEQTKMEAFLDWAIQGKPFIWQPDSASPNGLILIANYDTVNQINNDFEWLARSETTYGRLGFFESITS